MKSTRLDTYDNSHYYPGPAWKRALWYLLSYALFQSYVLPFSAPKAAVLRLFGARVGKGLRIKPAVRIKYPWLLTVGDHVWIGESVWIDNLAQVHLGHHVCLSQGAMLLTGNHNYKKPGFDLEVAGITLENGVWIGAQAIVCPGLKAASHAVLATGAVATTALEAYTVYAGNPAQAVRRRDLQ